jgi:hypothetical protein
MPRLSFRSESPVLVEKLLSALVVADCLVEPAGAGTWSVTHRAAMDKVEEYVELRFFLAAWQWQYGVDFAVLD